MITIVRLVSFFTAKYGGPYTHIMELTKQLMKMHVKTLIYTTSNIDQIGIKRTEFIEKKGRNFTVYRFNSFFRFREYRITPSLFPYFLKKAKNIDIIHSHAIRSFQEDIGSIISLIKKKPFLITPHGAIGINWEYKDKIPKMLHDASIGYLKKKLLNLHFIAVAKNEIHIIKRWGIDDDHIHLIPHGINTEIFKPVDSSDLKEKYNLEDYDVILYVGRIAKGKGIDILIKTLNLIIKKKKNVKLIIVGGNSGFLPIVNSLIQKYHLSKYIIFTGFISKNILPKYYSMADLVIYPSRQEIFGQVITEAGACGKTVIGSDIMGPKEIIVNGKTGYTSNFKNINELSEIILNLLNNKNLLIQMGKNALKRVTEKFSWEKTAKDHLDLYKKLLY